MEIVPTAEFYFTDDDISLMTDMSLAGRRSVNWNLLGVLGGEEKLRNKLASADHAARHGARVIPLTLPDPQAMRLSFETGFVYDMLPGWGDVMTMPHEARLARAARRRCPPTARGGESGGTVVGRLGGHHALRDVQPGERALGRPHGR